MAKWRNKINIKDMLTGDESNEQVLNVITHLLPQLKRIKTKENATYQLALEHANEPAIDESFLEEFDNLIQEFEWVRNSIESGADPSEYDYESWCEAFNGYLGQLYDVGDTLIEKRDFFNDEKFLWVG